MTNVCSTKLLDWRPAMNAFVTEISDLNANGVSFGRLFDDACDQGLVLVSHKTGVQVKFYIDREVVRDGEVVSWILLPTFDTTMKIPALIDTFVEVFND